MSIHFQMVLAEVRPRDSAHTSKIDSSSDQGYTRTARTSRRQIAVNERQSIQTENTERQPVMLTVTVIDTVGLRKVPVTENTERQPVMLTVAGARIRDH